MNAVGTYVLLIDVPRAIDVEVGALGTLAFSAGAYAYVGSAFGPGGLKRIDRHRELALGERDVRHWHVDYLLGHPETTLERVFVFPEEDRECELAGTLPGDPVRPFGASDCDCPAHLLVTEQASILDAIEAAGGSPADADRPAD
ncbi:DUF123 domain-containing protein [Natrialbaceae archaeon GCM10025810]|uniref:GIY-YIG nuclease family protein n=1 Tax=Halovalidus salilacus TaxID=3075124 RepID=UPI0036147E21